MRFHNLRYGDWLIDHRPGTGPVSRCWVWDVSSAGLVLRFDDNWRAEPRQETIPLDDVLRQFALGESNPKGQPCATVPIYETMTRDARALAMYAAGMNRHEIDQALGLRAPDLDRLGIVRSRTKRKVVSRG